MPERFVYDLATGRRLTPEECSPCGDKLKKARSARGKKKRTPDCPECYNRDCGTACRDALSALHKLSPPTTG